MKGDGRSQQPRRTKAAALRYDKSKDRAPRVLASGDGELARRILELASKSQVPVFQNADLVEILARLDLMQEIPPSCYRVVAEILYFVYRMNEQYGERSVPANWLPPASG